MPTYDYGCEANGTIVEVRHAMSETLTTWGELCAAAQLAPGDTPLDAPVRRLPTGGNLVNRSNLGSGPACGNGGCPSATRCAKG